MKKNTKKILAFSILAMFIVIFISGVVSAAEPTDILNPIGNWFTSWEEGENFSANIAKYLFWALVSIVIYSVSSKIPGLETIFKGSKWLGWVFSIIIGFLSMAYITPDEVFAMMGSYSALGFVIGGALPFIILIFFTINLASESSNTNAAKRLSTRLLAMGMWTIFTVFLFTRAIGSPDQGNPLLEWILVTLSVAITIAMSKIFEKVRKDLSKEEKQIAENTSDIQNLVLKIDQDRYDAMKGSGKKK